MKKVLCRTVLFLTVTWLHGVVEYLESLRKLKRFDCVTVRRYSAKVKKCQSMYIRNAADPNESTSNFSEIYQQYKEPNLYVKKWFSQKVMKTDDQIMWSSPLMIQAAVKITIKDLEYLFEDSSVEKASFL